MSRRIAQQASHVSVRRAHPSGRVLVAMPGLFVTLVVGAFGATMAAARGAVITGQVVQDGGEPMPFADVFLEGDTVHRAELADEEGRFRMAGLPPGEYSLHAHVTGFDSEKYASIVLEPGAHRRFVIRTVPRERFVEDLVIDAERAGLVETERIAIKSTIDGDFIDRIPLVNRRIPDIVFLFPGVIRSGSQESTEIGAGGGSGAQIGYRVDGATLSDPLDGGAAMEVSSAAMERVSLTTTGVTPEHGEHSSGIVELTTRSGTNEFRFRHATDWRGRALGAWRLQGLEPVLETVHALATAEDTGLASEVERGFALLGVDELSTREDDSNPPGRDRTRHAISTSGPIVRDKAFFHATLETLSDDRGSAFVEGVSSQDQLLFTGKLDWNVSQRNRLSLTTNVDISDSVDLPGPFEAPDLVSTSKRGGWLLTMTDTHELSSSSFLQTRLSSLRLYRTNRPRDPRQGVGTQVAVRLPPGGVASYTAGDVSSDSDRTLQTLRLEQTLSLALGRSGAHQVDVGGMVEHLGFHARTALGRSLTDLRVLDDSDVLEPSSTVGFVVDRGPPVDVDESSFAAALHVRDRWSLPRDLTLELALRADYQDFVGELFLSPRFGFSFDPTGKGLMHVFGSWGIYHDDVAANALEWAATPERFLQDIRFAPAFRAREFSETSILDIHSQAAATSSSGALAADAVAYLDPVFRDRFALSEDLTSPITKKWSIAVERRLPADVRVQVAYTENERRNQATTIVETRRQAQFDGEYTIRDVLFATSGSGSFQQWSLELQAPFGKRWRASASYVWSRNTGPIVLDQDSTNPRDVAALQGVLPNDRTHVVKVQASVQLPKKVELTTDFTWQSGQPYTPVLTRRDGTTERPFDVNSRRLPSVRQLNLSVGRSFLLGKDKRTELRTELRVFNVLGDLNVFAGIPSFENPSGVADVSSLQPLRPIFVPTGVDVGRSMELGVSVSF